ncbi:MAG TPA: carbohydrate porin, partial [Caulobacteraceae bacterium]|nr:carbohydrate porin [Caulobacteraceae bacterium]
MNALSSPITRACRAVCLGAGIALAAASGARADDAPSGWSDPNGFWAIHLQSTLTWQGHPAFTSPYSGANSMNASTNGRETFDATVYGGLHPWAGGEIWINPEIDQGFGLSNTLGVAGFPSGEAYKVGAAAPYAKLQRFFLRQTFDLGGERSKTDADLNQFPIEQSADRLVVTVGKMSVVDIFDNNSLAHDPRNDFLNWSLIDAGSFDYASNAWGYTLGAAAEWYTGAWTLRAGAFDLSAQPNSTELDYSLHQFQLVGEIERRYRLGGQNGDLKVTGFLSRGRMGLFSDAIALAQATGQPATLAPVRSYRSRPGVSLNLEQDLTKDLGLFVRAGWADGKVEPFDFADIDETVSGGLSLAGTAWGRKDDRVAIAGVVN